MEMTPLPLLKKGRPAKKDFYEAAAWKQGYTIMGLDEVGRGCLAGPIMTAAVILNCNKKSRLLRDSKVMTSQEREQAFKWINKNAQWVVSVVDNRVIDKLNIWHATLKAMK